MDKRITLNYKTSPSAIGATPRHWLQSMLSQDSIDGLTGMKSMNDRYITLSMSARIPKPYRHDTLCVTMPTREFSITNTIACLLPLLKEDYHLHVIVFGFMEMLRKLTSLKSHADACATAACLCSFTCIPLPHLRSLRGSRTSL